MQSYPWKAIREFDFASHLFKLALKRPFKAEYLIENMKKIAVIGTGYLGRHHARILSGAKGVQLAGVVDIDRKRAEEIALAYNSVPYTNFLHVLPLVDAVSIVTPTETHLEIAMECLKEGKDVFVEKPITAALDEADELIKSARDRGLVLQVGHIERFNPVLEEAFSLLRDPFFIEAERVSPYLGRGVDVDITIDLMIHDLDIALSAFKFPEIKNVKAIGASRLTGRLDYCKAWVDFENGCSAVFTASRLATAKRRSMNILEKDGFMEIDFISRKLNFKSVAGENAFEAEDREPLKEELESFIQCIGERSVPKVKPHEAREALALALRISETARNGAYGQ